MTNLHRSRSNTSIKISISNRYFILQTISRSAMGPLAGRNANQYRNLDVNLSSARIGINLMSKGDGVAHQVRLSRPSTGLPTAFGHRTRSTGQPKVTGSIS